MGTEPDPEDSDPYDPCAEEAALIDHEEFPSVGGEASHNSDRATPRTIDGGIRWIAGRTTEPNCSMTMANRGQTPDRVQTR
jgi:hypothetical protein